MKRYLKKAKVIKSKLDNIILKSEMYNITITQKNKMKLYKY